MVRLMTLIAIILWGTRCGFVMGEAGVARASDREKRHRC